MPLLADWVDWSPFLGESDYSAAGCDGSAKLVNFNPDARYSTLALHFRFAGRCKGDSNVIVQWYVDHVEFDSQCKEEQQNRRHLINGCALS